MNRFKTDAVRVPGMIFAFSFFLYISVRSVFFNFDGVACAIAVELSDFKHLVHGNHLAYGVLAWGFDALCRLLGYGGRALYPLQLLSGLLGAAAAAAFSSLLLRGGRSAREAALAGAALAVSHAWWFWSLEAQVYMLGALFIALAAREALGENPDPKLVGLWHGAAILGHVGHLMAAPALIWALRKRERRTLLEYGAAAILLVALAYAAAALFAVRPASFEDWRRWLLGSAALTYDRSFYWHSYPLIPSLLGWLRMSVEITWAKGAGTLLGIVPLLAAARGLRRGGPTARFWGLWLAGYAVLYVSWEPTTIVYRITDLLAVYALALDGLDGWSRPARAAALAAWCAATGLYNWRTAIAPATRPGAYADFEESRWVGERTPDNAWVLAVGRGQVYVPYFALRKPLNPRYWRDEAELFARLDAIAAAGEPVYATDISMDISTWKESFVRYGLEETASGEGLRLYRVRRAVKSAASRSAKGGKN